MAKSVVWPEDLSALDIIRRSASLRRPPGITPCAGPRPPHTMQCNHKFGFLETVLLFRGCVRSVTPYLCKALYHRHFAQQPVRHCRPVKPTDVLLYMDPPHCARTPAISNCSNGRRPASEDPRGYEDPPQVKAIWVTTKSIEKVLSIFATAT